MRCKCPQRSLDRQAGWRVDVFYSSSQAESSLLGFAPTRIFVEPPGKQDIVALDIASPLFVLWDQQAGCGSINCPAYVLDQAARLPGDHRSSNSSL